MSDEGLPDSPEANRAGCSCPRNENQNGAGTVVDGVKTYTIAKSCPIHTNLRFWLPKREKQAL